MKTGPLLTVAVVVSFLVSSVSLAYQVKSKTSSKFEKFMVPARETDLERRLVLADIQMIHDGLPMYQGISLARVWGLSDQRIIVRRFVSEKELPVTYDDRKKALRDAAILSAGSVLAQFGTDELSLNDVKVEFKSIEDFGRNNDRNYAVYSNGELTFH